MDRGLCAHCGANPVGARKRKYCDPHSREASAIWKRAHRKLWKAQGDRYWLADWKHKTDEERREYFRTYMRTYRLQKRTQKEGTTDGRA